jgi:hypothetical protein
VTLLSFQNTYAFNQKRLVSIRFVNIIDLGQFRALAWWDLAWWGLAWWSVALSNNRMSVVWIVGRFDEILVLFSSAIFRKRA